MVEKTKTPKKSNILVKVDPQTLEVEPIDNIEKLLDLLDLQDYASATDMDTGEEITVFRRSHVLLKLDKSTAN